MRNYPASSLQVGISFDPALSLSGVLKKTAPKNLRMHSVVRSSEDGFD
jgi:hypothetical protein